MNTAGGLPSSAFSCEGRTALLGGTFNPVHIGHLRLALEVAEAMGLSRVELLPSANPPHKPADGLLPYDLRVKMLRAAIEGEPLLGVCLLEGELAPPSYTWNTARAWAKRHGEAALFILGDEDFACLNSWRHGLELPGIMDLVVVPRSGTPKLFIQTLERFWPGRTCHPEPFPTGALRMEMGGGRCCWFLPVPRIELSATSVRQRWLTGRSLRYLLPDGALAVLHEHEKSIRDIWPFAAH